MRIGRLVQAASLFGVAAFVMTASARPEPATLSMIGGALMGLGLWRRKGLSRQ